MGKVEANDATLVQRARAGDRRAFGQLLTCYSETAMHLARRMVGAECAREMVQEGALQALLSLDRLEEDASFGAWFCGIVLNLCRGHLRRRQRELSWEDLVGGTYVEEVALVDAEPSPAEQAEALDLHRQVLAAVEDLNPKIRRAALLFYFEQLSLKEIAALLEISVGAVKGRLFKARQQLADSLWPLYIEWRDSDERKMDMTQVEIADVVSLEPNQNYSVSLLDRVSKRKILMTIGHAEGSALSMFLRGVNLPRPVWSQLTVSILDALDAELVQVRIEKLEQDIFYAVVVVKGGDGTKELDARPSDAMCIAALKNAPIYVTDGVWEQVGQDCSDEEIAQMGQSLAEQGDELVKKFASAAVTYKAVAENPGAGQLARIEVARCQVAPEALDGLGPGDALPVGTGPTWLYLDEMPRFAGSPMVVGGRAGISLNGMIADGEVAVGAEKGKRQVSVELGRGWVEWATGVPSEDWAGVVVYFPQKLEESVQVWVDGAHWATGTMHISGDGYVVKIAELA